MRGREALRAALKAAGAHTTSLLKPGAARSARHARLGNEWWIRWGANPLPCQLCGDGLEPATASLLIIEPWPAPPELVAICVGICPMCIAQHGNGVRSQVQRLLAVELEMPELEEVTTTWLH
jgi:hypothetical protein